MEIFLASKSARRRALLAEVFPNFHSLQTEVSEILDENINPSEQILALARKKARAGHQQAKSLTLQNFFVVAGDTMVFLGEQALGKPQTRQEAKDYLQALANKTHRVLSAVCVLNQNSDEVFGFCDQTEVVFRNLNNEEIEAYLDLGFWSERAGGYGIQDALSEDFVSQLTGSQKNVVGFPVERFTAEAVRHGLLSYGDHFLKNFADFWQVAGKERVLAVSKKQSVEKILTAYWYGQRDFAENYVQEWVQKSQRLGSFSDLRWHLIGRLQSNKVKQVVGKVFAIHSVDSVRVLEKINSVAASQELCQNIYLQCNFWQEESKSGMSPEELAELWQKLWQQKDKYANVQVLGVMLMPPLFASEEEAVREYEYACEWLERRLVGFQASGMLSAGTSGDYRAALQVGTRWLRIGTRLFGERLG